MEPAGSGVPGEIETLSENRDVAIGLLEALQMPACISHVVSGRAWPGTVLLANQAMADLAASHTENLPGTAWTGLWQRSSRFLDASELASLESGKAAEAEFVRADGGDSSWFEVTIAPFREDLLLTILRDTTEAWRSNEQLSKERQRLAESQDLAELGSWEWDIAFDLVHWSAKLYEIFGLDPEGFEATLDAYLERVHPDDRDQAAAQVQSSLETGKPFESDYRIVHVDGSVRWLHSRGRVEFDESGVPVVLSGVCQDITPRKELEDLLLHQSLHDPLTGLPNRFLLVDRVEIALAALRRSKSSFAVCFVDVDGFKRINDSLGHEVGDSVLRELAIRLKSILRPADTVSRVGGDEFVVVATDVSSRQLADDLGRRVNESLRQVVQGSDGESTVTVSVGVALAKADDLPSTLLLKADQAMYRAKRLGRDQWAIYGDR